MKTSPRKFTPRISQINGFSIYVGPCSSCPSAIEPWIKQFCSMPDHKWYVPIDREWAADWFNNYGMKELFPNYDIAINIISDQHSDEWAYLSDEDVSAILVQARQLYGLLHARWICQTKGLNQMKKKYEAGIFGVCPRFNCKGKHLLPMGTTLKPRHHSVKLFCPECCDIYLSPPNMRLDGAHFGPAFPHIFLSEFTNFNTSSQFEPYQLVAFGFPIRNTRNKYEPHSTNYHEDEFPKNG